MGATQTPKVTMETLDAESSESPVKGRVVLSGSFNPLHDGHLQLLQSASAKCGNKQACFEMTLSNADKGKLSVDDP